MGKRKHTFEYVLEAFMENDCVLVSSFDDDFYNRNVDLQIICKHHLDKGVQNKTWSNIYKNQFNCKYCGWEQKWESQRFTMEEVKKKFEDRNYTLITTEYNRNDEKLEYTCNNHFEEGAQFITLNKLKLGSGCWHCYIESKTGENHWNWKGGKSTLIEMLRKELSDWKKDSMENCQYRCLITGSKNYEIHHLYGFDLILIETLNQLNIDNKHIQINELTVDNYETIKSIFLKIHNKYPLGVCLEKEIHKEFHRIYGKGNNTPEQFYEFKVMKQQELANLNKNNLNTNSVKEVNDECFI